MMLDKTMVVILTTLDGLKNVTPVPTETADAVNRITGTGSTWDNFMQLVGLFVLLIVILVAAYFTSKFVGGIKLGQMKNSNFQVIDAYRISQNKVIQIVKIANKYIVIAIGKDTINYITELDEAEVYVREMHTGDKLSFKQTLEKIRNLNK